MTDFSGILEELKSALREVFSFSAKPVAEKCLFENPGIDAEAARGHESPYDNIGRK
jgi:hypothetical protein